MPSPGSVEFYRGPSQRGTHQDTVMRMAKIKFKERILKAAKGKVNPERAAKWSRRRSSPLLTRTLKSEKSVEQPSLKKFETYQKRSL